MVGRLVGLVCGLVQVDRCGGSPIFINISRHLLYVICVFGFVEKTTKYSTISSTEIPSSTTRFYPINFLFSFSIFSTLEVGHDISELRAVRSFINTPSLLQQHSMKDYEVPQMVTTAISFVVRPRDFIKRPGALNHSGVLGLEELPMWPLFIHK